MDTIPVINLDIFIAGSHNQEVVIQECKKVCFFKITGKWSRWQNPSNKLLGCSSSHWLWCTGSSRLACKWERQCSLPWFDGGLFWSVTGGSTKRWAHSTRLLCGLLGMVFRINAKPRMPQVLTYPSELTSELEHTEHTVKPSKLQVFLAHEQKRVSSTKFV